MTSHSELKGTGVWSYRCSQETRGLGKPLRALKSLVETLEELYKNPDNRELYGTLKEQLDEAKRVLKNWKVTNG